MQDNLGPSIPSYAIANQDCPEVNRVWHFWSKGMLMKCVYRSCI